MQDHCSLVAYLVKVRGTRISATAISTTTARTPRTTCVQCGLLVNYFTGGFSKSGSKEDKVGNHYLARNLFREEILILGVHGTAKNAALNPSTPVDLLDKPASAENENVRMLAAQNPSTTDDTLAGKVHVGNYISNVHSFP